MAKARKTGKGSERSKGHVKGVSRCSRWSTAFFLLGTIARGKRWLVLDTTALRRRRGYDIKNLKDTLEQGTKKAIKEINLNCFRGIKRNEVFYSVSVSISPVTGSIF